MEKLLEKYEKALREIASKKGMCIYSDEEEYRRGTHDAFYEAAEIAQEALRDENKDKD